LRHAKVGPFLSSLLLLGLTSCGGSEGPGTTEPDPPRAVSITVTQTSVTLSFVGATTALNASIRDQNGQLFSSTISWSSDDPAVVTVDAAGLLTAVQNGTATVTAASGSLSATVAVTVQQVATQLAIVSGDGQSAPVGQALPEAPVVRAEDAGGATVAGVSLALAVSSGGGSVGSATVVTDAEGLASTSWTLGTMAGLQQVSVSIAGAPFPPIELSATGIAAAASTLAKASGDLQVGPLSLALSAPIAVQLQDEFGNGVAEGEVTFLVTGGGGSVNPAVTTTGDDGTAQTTWTMGSVLGGATLTATATGFAPVAFTATAVPATPDLVAGALSVSPAVPTSLQTFTVTVPVTNEGTVTTGTTFPVQLLVDGAEVESKTIGPLLPSASTDVAFTVGPLAAGERALSAVVDPTASVAESDEGNNTSGQSVTVAAQATLVVGTPLTGLGAVKDVELLFAFELPVADGSIEFTLTGNTTDDADVYVHQGERPLSRDDYTACISGNFDSNEACRVNAALPGTYHILVHAFTTFAGATLSVATGLEVLPFDIEVVYVDTPTNPQRDAFTTAAEQWESIIPFDITDIPFDTNPQAAGACGVTWLPAIDDTVDDLRIYVKLDSIDGAGGVLGSASFCTFRTLSGLPVIGFMEFDTADLNSLEANESLGAVVAHEMGHVLGIGTLWSRAELIRNPSLGNPGVDTYFAGPLAIAAFDDAGGAAYSGEKVPVENSGTAGSADGHWRESVLRTELMTPQLDVGTEPLSAISVQSLADVGYRVDVTQADAYVLPISSAAAVRGRGPVIDLSNDIWIGTILGVDAQGRLVRTIRR
jgi:hypothetical protein